MTKCSVRFKMCLGPGFSKSCAPTDHQKMRNKWESSGHHSSSYLEEWHFCCPAFCSWYRSESLQSMPNSQFHWSSNMNSNVNGSSRRFRVLTVSAIDEAANVSIDFSIKKSSRNMRKWSNKSNKLDEIPGSNSWISQQCRMVCGLTSSQQRVLWGICKATQILRWEFPRNEVR